jgi:hypothetical protein
MSFWSDRSALSKTKIHKIQGRDPPSAHFVFLLEEVYYESIKREPKRRGRNKCRCDERLQTKTKEFTRLPYTGLVLELEHLKIETRLISERFANAMEFLLLIYHNLRFVFYNGGEYSRNQEST